MIRRKRLISLTLLPLLADRIGVGAFAPSPLSTPPSSISIASGSERARRSGRTDLHAFDDDDEDPIIADRRNALRKLSLAFLSTASAASSIVPQRANAASPSSSSSDLFKPNPLLNPVLEKVRIWNQDEVDNIKYGGELESGSAKPAAFDQYVALLQPILAVEGDLVAINELVNDGKLVTKEDYQALFAKVDAMLSKSQFDKINFKKAFNAFADNIYYSDPDRANLYLGGGAVPKNTQSIAYLLRNDVLTNVEDMRAESKYLLKELGKRADGEKVVVGEGGLELDEMLSLSRTAREGMTKYLDLVPPNELVAARAKFSPA